MPIRNWDLPPGIKTIEVNGYDMAYLEQGHGPALVLIHGSLNDYRAWAFQMEPFSTGYRTIAVSLRHAYPERWDGQGDGFSVRRHAEDLALFIRALDAGPVHIVAHSRGGDIALILASLHPMLVQSMVLADPAPFNDMLPDTPEVRAQVQYRATFVTSAMERLQQNEVDKGLEIFMDAVSVPGHWQRLPDSVKQIRRDNAWSLTSLVTDAQEAFGPMNAEKIEAPVLLVTADKSPRLYGLMHAALQPCLPSVQKATITGASHGMNRDNPNEFNSVVLDFLAGH